VFCVVGVFGGCVCLVCVFGLCVPGVWCVEVSVVCLGV